MTVLNYTTTIAASKTIAEVQGLLARHGAARVAIEYDNGAASGVAFTLKTPHGDRLFTLPVNVDAMHALLIREYRAGRLKGAKSKASAESREQAERVAWRVIKDWLSAQLALVQTQMAQLDQVMLPYLHVDANHTLYAAYKQREDVLALNSGQRSWDAGGSEEARADGRHWTTETGGQRCSFADSRGLAVFVDDGECSACGSNFRDGIQTGESGS